MLVVKMAVLALALPNSYFERLNNCIAESLMGVHDMVRYRIILSIYGLL